MRLVRAVSVTALAAAAAACSSASGPPPFDKLVNETMASTGLAVVENLDLEHIGNFTREQVPPG